MRLGVPTVTDRFVSPGMLKSDLRRWWPLWLAYGVALFLVLVVPVYSTVNGLVAHHAGPREIADSLDGMWGLLRAEALLLALAASGAVALALNEHLFDAPAATFVGALPLRRRRVYATKYLAGLVVLLVVPALAAACLLPLHAVAPQAFRLVLVCRWYVLTAAYSLVFYALAVLACQLAGSRPVALLLYCVLNFLVVCLEVALRMVVSDMLYGVGMGKISFDWMSPPVRLAQMTLGGAGGGLGGLAAFQWRAIAAYLAASVVVALFAGWLYERRDLEVAGSSIAFDSLRPILRYLAGISMALLFGGVLCALGDLHGTVHQHLGAGGYLAFLAALAAGGFLGLLFSEMIMVRSTHVLGSCWKGGLALALAAACLVGACFFDAFGVVGRVPDPSQVECVTIRGSYQSEAASITSEQGVREVCDLHRDVLALDGTTGPDDGQDTFYLDLTYELEGGETLVRLYPVQNNYFAEDTEPKDEGAQIVGRFAALCNSPEGRESRFADVLDTDGLGEVTLEYDQGNGEYVSVTLSADERRDLVEHALRQDLMEEGLGEVFVDLYPVEYAGREVLLALYADDAGDDPEDYATYLYGFQVSEESSPNTAAWVREHYPQAWGG